MFISYLFSMPLALSLPWFHLRNSHRQRWEHCTYNSAEQKPAERFLLGFFIDTPASAQNPAPSAVELRFVASMLDCSQQLGERCRNTFRRITARSERPVNSPYRLLSAAASGRARRADSSSRQSAAMRSTMAAAYDSAAVVQNNESTGPAKAGSARMICGFPRFRIPAICAEGLRELGNSLQ